MKTATRTIDSYIERAKAKMLRKYPELQFEVKRRSPEEAFLFFYGPYDTDNDGVRMLDAAGDVMSDAVVNEGYLLYVLPRD